MPYAYIHLYGPISFIRTIRFFTKRRFWGFSFLLSIIIKKKQNRRLVYPNTLALLDFTFWAVPANVLYRRGFFFLLFYNFFSCHPRLTFRLEILFLSKSYCKNTLVGFFFGFGRRVGGGGGWTGIFTVFRFFTILLFFFFIFCGRNSDRNIRSGIFIRTVNRVRQFIVAHIYSNSIILFRLPNGAKYIGGPLFFFFFFI